VEVVTFIYLGIKLAIYGMATLFAPIALQLVLLYYLSFYLQKVIARVFGFELSVYLTAPGTIVHELSHFLACMVTGTPVAELALFSPREEPPGSGRWVLGEVVRGSASYLANMIISIAPFFGCTAAMIFVIVVMIPGFKVPPFPMSDLSYFKLYTIADAFIFLYAYCATYVTYLINFVISLNWLDLRTYIFIMITFTIAPGIAPSSTDLKHFFSALGVVMLFLIPLALIFHLCGVPLISLTRSQMGNMLIVLSSYLGMATIICLGGLILFSFIDFIASFWHSGEEEGVQK
jgi:hypothetical protein